MVLKLSERLPRPNVGGVAVEVLDEEKYEHDFMQKYATFLTTNLSNESVSYENCDGAR